MRNVSVILAGGYGERLYPMSTKEKPKQFVELIEGKTMLDYTIDNLDMFDNHRIYINTLKRYEEYLIDNKNVVLLEEEKNGTAFSVHQVSLYFKQLFSDAVIVLVPADHYIYKDKDKYQESINKAIEVTKKNNCLTLIGIKADEEKHDDLNEFGFIKYSGDRVVKFVEKPSYAKELLREGALLNSGIFVFKASYMYELFRGLGLSYENLKGSGMSFENEVVENIDNIRMVKGDFDWVDIGNLERLSKVMLKD